MDPIIWYLESGELLKDKAEVRYQVTQYTIIDEVLYKIGFSLPYWSCLDAKEARYVLEEIHEGVCSNHTIGRSLAHKVTHQSYY